MLLAGPISHTCTRCMDFVEIFNIILDLSTTCFSWVLSFLYVYSDHSILECYNLFSGVELSMRSFFVICQAIYAKPTLDSIFVIGTATVFSLTGAFL